MICVKCGKTAPDGPYCALCGAPQQRQRSSHRRGNGQGTVYKTSSGKYKAVIILGYYIGDDGAMHALKKDAVAALTSLRTAPAPERHTVTFKALYDRWLPTHRAGKSTINCYKAAIKHFAPLYGLPFADVAVDDLQECIDTCPHGKRTRENMRAAVGLMYKYALPRRLVPDRLNLADYLTVTGDAAAHRDAFTPEQIEAIRQGVGKAPGADLVYALIYLGYRPSEYLALDCAQAGLGIRFI